MTRRRALALGLAVVGLLVAWAAVAALVARAKVARARDRLEALRDGGDADRAAIALSRAASDLRSARSWLGQPGPAVVAHVPVLGRSLVAIRVVDSAALDVVRAAQPVVEIVRSGKVLRDHAVDLDRLSMVAGALRQAADRTERVPARLHALRTGWTPPGVARNVRLARAKLGDTPGSLRRTADLLDALSGMLGRSGPRRMLVVLENNAELRGSGGLISVVAELVADQGRITLGKFTDVVDIAESRGFARPVPAPKDYVARYGRFLANTTLWRNANMPPDIGTSSQVLSAIAAKSLGRRPTAVFTLDVRAIASLIGATGPVGTLTEANAVDELLSKAYAEAPDTRKGQDQRREKLRLAADAVVRKLLDGEASAVGLAAALGDAAAGRHVALWSAVAGEQRAFVAAGVAGAVPADTSDVALVTVHNLGGGSEEGNKLDYYARVETSVRVRVGRTSATTTRTYTLRNTAPATGLPRYVAGVDHPGQSASLLSFYLPDGARSVSLSRGDTAISTDAVDEGGLHVLEDVALLAPGTSLSWTLTYVTPVAGHYTLRLVPQPMAYDATLRLDVQPARDAYFGAVSYTGPFATVRRVDVRPKHGSWWQRAARRLHRFWDEPVSL